MAENEGKKTKVTVKSIERDAWQKPGSNTYHYDVRIEEHPSEPIKFIQNRDKQAPEPKVGQSYEGMAYPSDKGYTFYPFPPKPQGYQRPAYRQNDPETQKEIRAIACVKSAAEYCAHVGVTGEELESITASYSLFLYQQVDVLKDYQAPTKSEVVPDDASGVEDMLDDSKPIDMSAIPF